MGGCLERRDVSRVRAVAAGWGQVHNEVELLSLRLSLFFLQLAMFVDVLYVWIFLGTSKPKVRP